MDNDLLVSVGKYVENSTEFTTIFSHVKPYALGFLTKLGMELCEKYTIKELFIDSTYKTNREKVELYSVMASVMGLGFPISYFLLGPRENNRETRRKEVILMYLKQLRESSPSLSPLFSSQIRTLLNLMGLLPRSGFDHHSVCGT